LSTSGWRNQINLSTVVNEDIFREHTHSKKISANPGRPFPLNDTKMNAS
jgi:hypothetical protein